MSNAAKRVTSRRKPRLKVVGSPGETTPHATSWAINGYYYRCEVWTFDEWTRLSHWEKPPASLTTLMPGIGYQTLCRVAKAEYDDLQDVVFQVAGRLGLEVEDV